jgi:hypothetical protein
MGRFDKFKVYAEFPEDFGQPTEKEKKDTGKAWPFRPGLYKDVEISAVVEGNPSKKDPSWVNYVFTFKSGRNEIRKFVMVPTEGLEYGPEQSAGVFSMLVKFLKVFGVDLTTKNAGEIIPQLFENPACFVGQKADITVWHKAHYAHFVDKNTFHVMDSFDRPVCEKGTQNPMSFPSQDACEVYVTDHLHKEFSVFPEVKYINPPTTKPDKPLLLPKEKKEKAKGKVSW